MADSLLALIFQVLGILAVIMFWYHLSGIHAAAKRAADNAQWIAEHLHQMEARQIAAQMDANRLTTERRPTSPLGLS